MELKYSNRVNSSFYYIRNTQCNIYIYYIDWSAKGWKKNNWHGIYFDFFKSFQYIQNMAAGIKIKR